MSQSTQTIRIPAHLVLPTRSTTALHLRTTLDRIYYQEQKKRDFVLGRKEIEKLKKLSLLSPILLEGSIIDKSVLNTLTEEQESLLRNFDQFTNKFIPSNKHDFHPLYRHRPPS